MLTLIYSKGPYEPCVLVVTTNLLGRINIIMDLMQFEQNFYALTVTEDHNFQLYFTGHLLGLGIDVSIRPYVVTIHPIFNVLCPKRLNSRTGLKKSRLELFNGEIIIQMCLPQFHKLYNIMFGTPTCIRLKTQGWSNNRDMISHFILMTSTCEIQ